MMRVNRQLAGGHALTPSILTDHHHQAANNIVYTGSVTVMLSSEINKSTCHTATFINSHITSLEDTVFVQNQQYSSVTHQIQIYTVVHKNVNLLSTTTLSNLNQLIWSSHCFNWEGIPHRCACAHT